MPHSIEAEQGLLGSMLIAPSEVVDMCIDEGIDATAFYIPAHATVFDILVELWNKGTPADFITLTQVLRDRKLLDGVGGPAFPTHLFTFTPTAVNARYYLDIIRDHHRLRALITTALELANRAYIPMDSEEVRVLIDDAEKDILAVRMKSAGRETMPSFNDGIMQAIENIEKLYESRGAVTGLPTGLKELDRLTGGLQNAQMFIIAARPSMGKTAIAMGIAEHVAITAQLPVAIFSLEMSMVQLIERMLCSRARVNLQKVRDGFLTERDFPNLTAAAEKLSGGRVFIDDTAGLSILELRAAARRMKKTHGIRLIVVDYLQLLRSTTRRAAENRQLEISEISQGLKALAKELNIPIIVLAQLNRNPEGRANGRPRLADLRESGSLEQDADTVGLLVRSEYYAEDEEAKREVAGEAELIIAKQRTGPVGDIKLTFIKEFTRFEDRAHDGRAPVSVQIVNFGGNN